jgi:exodeoxyribonuclease VII small subunit
MQEFPMSEQPTFTQALKRLEEIVAKLEQPDLELEQGLALLEEGVRLHKLCQDTLTTTQQKITKLLSQPVERDEVAGVVPSAAEPEPAHTELPVTTPSEIDPWTKPNTAKPESKTSDLFSQTNDEGLPF